MNHQFELLATLVGTTRKEFVMRGVLVSSMMLLVGVCSANAGQIINVYLMAGQSNMQGVGRTSEIPSELLPQPNVQLFHSTATSSTGGANKLIPNQANGFSSGHFGPEIGFGARLSKLHPQQQFVLIKHAVGGTDLNDDWRPGEFGNRRTQGVEFRTFTDTVNAGLEAIAAAKPDAEIRIRGMVWQQGEEDSKFENFANAYGQNFNTFIGRVRQEFNVPAMPFVYGKVHDVVGNEVPAYVHNDTILSAQMAVDQDSGDPLAVSGAFVVDSSGYLTHGDLQDGFRDDDFAHFASEPMIDLGKAYADTFAKRVPEPSACAMLGVAMAGCALRHQTR